MENRLREIRKNRGISQEELAAMTKINRVTIARYETGRIIPGAENLFKLASALECTADELMKQKAG